MLRAKHFLVNRQSFLRQRNRLAVTLSRLKLFGLRTQLLRSDEIVALRPYCCRPPQRRDDDGCE